MNGMSGLATLLTAVTIVLVTSTGTALAIHGPLRRQLAALCPVDTTAAFWTRSTVALLYLLPLFLVMWIGLPRLTHEEFTTAEVVRRTLATSAATLTLIVVAIGLRLSFVSPPTKFDYPPVR
jgi:hypothetical protein